MTRSATPRFPFPISRFRLCGVLLVAIAVLGPTLESSAQQRPPARFFINTVGDTTFTFRVPSDPWVEPGAEGIAVDPARRDSLVARFRVSRVDWGEATAVIMGQTTAVTNAHVVLLRMPPTPWYRRHFWIGVLTGAGIGAGIAAGIR
ncbi:MAG TPA: hypothetical protein VMM77_09550 [Gemmatimonadaceae bacterium]|nr:hypothetical protein [Gemmatimonadaceae bacterium]